MLKRISQGLDRWSVRRRQFDGTAETLDSLYTKPDPWKLGSREQARFEGTNALIAQFCPPLASILEVGCGEGYQTRYFRGIADQVTGIDISATALARARVAVPKAVFLEGTLPSFLPLLRHRNYDLVTLCEVLIYGNDPATLIAAAQSCGAAVIITSYEPQSHSLSQLCSGSDWSELPEISSGRKRWKAYLWRSNASTKLT
ncbi:class I SAM-dependent methyltransferase [Sphingomonas sp. HMP6]|uniref:class I SAM-dependent methyltransferase n=1 Tax=Sphingomonas sp. HMP6 TaxID=1517551 RepID=UPI0015970EA5|nr:class I SAM-dependent methyltransferase [Sphingomonas sp. HMP6]BCA58670.1 hypothetical protein HMP06_1439 [Sphingomonas sp. HMP6]